MEKLSIKGMIESCIADLMDNQSLSTIFLKVQAISFYLKNDQFAKWFESEKNGYKNSKELPEYRKSGCQVFGNINNPYKGMFTNYHIPVDQIKNKDIRSHLANCSFFESIIELENIVQSQEDKSIRKYVPGFLHNEIQKIFSTGYYIDAVWQTVSKSTIVQIVESVKSKLLQFFLEMDEQLFNNEIDFDVMTKKKEIDKIFNQTINAGVYNQGDMTISDSTVIGGQSNEVHINTQTKNEIENILNQIETLSIEIDEDRTDIADAILSIREELENKIPRPRFLKTAFNSLKAIGTGVFANQITPLVNSAIEIINKM